jgi:hypothetical protein
MWVPLFYFIFSFFNSTPLHSSPCLAAGTAPRRRRRSSSAGCLDWLCPCWRSSIHRRRPPRPQDALASFAVPTPSLAHTPRSLSPRCACWIHCGSAPPIAPSPSPTAANQRSFATVPGSLSPFRPPIHVRLGPALVDALARGAPCLGRHLGRVHDARGQGGTVRVPTSGGS